MNWPLSFFVHSHLHGVNGFDVAVRVAFKFRRGGEINARVGAEFRGGFLLAVIQLVNLRPFRPGIVLGAFQRRLGQNFHLHQALQPCRIEVPTQSVPVSPPPMTTTSLPVGVNETAVLVAVQNALGVRGEKIHREMNALEFAAVESADRAAWSRRSPESTASNSFNNFSAG